MGGLIRVGRCRYFKMNLQKLIRSTLWSESQKGRNFRPLLLYLPLLFEITKHLDRILKLPKFVILESKSLKIGR